MNVNTVTIETKEYNLLRDFKNAIEAKNTVVMEWWGSGARIVSESVIVEAYAKEVELLKEDIINLKSEINGEKTETVSSLREMSLWRLLKWKFKNN